MTFLRRLGQMLADLLTSKKAMATIAAIASGVDPKVAISAYVVAQGVADHGAKEAEKARWRASDEVMAEKLKSIREGQTP